MFKVRKKKVYRNPFVEIEEYERIVYSVHKAHDFAYFLIYEDGEFIWLPSSTFEPVEEN